MGTSPLPATSIETSMSHRLAALLLVVAFAPGVHAAIPPSLHTAGAAGAGCVVQTVPDTTPPAQYLFCDDGIPQASGGTTPNEGGVQAVTVPAEYDGYEGLPPKKTPTTVGGADLNGDIALDAAAGWRLPAAVLHARLLWRQQDELGRR
jgi:hypothetical protein